MLEIKCILLMMKFFGIFFLIILSIRIECLQLRNLGEKIQKRIISTSDNKFSLDHINILSAAYLPENIPQGSNS